MALEFTDITSTPLTKIEELISLLPLNNCVQILVGEIILCIVGVVGGIVSNIIVALTDKLSFQTASREVIDMLLAPSERL